MLTLLLSLRQKSLWTGGRAAEGTGLLNRRTGYTGTAGSNPALSVPKKLTYGQFFYLDTSAYSL